MHGSFISPLAGAAYVGPTYMYKNVYITLSRIGVQPLCAVLLYT